MSLSSPITQHHRPAPSQAGGSPMSVSPIKSGRPTGGGGDDDDDDDDPSTWTKSKKKRMRMKRKKEEAVAAAASASGSDGKHQHDNVGKKNIADSSSNKRQRKNSPESAVKIVTNAIKDTTNGNHTKHLTRDVNDNSDEVSGSGKKKRKKKKKQQQSVNDTLESISTANGNANEQSTPKSMTTKNNDKNKPSSTNQRQQPQLPTSPSPIKTPLPSQMSTLQKSFLARLTSSRFRELNEELYTQSSHHSFEQFTSQPELFEQYHVGFRKQVKEWPVNPVDVICRKIVSGWKKVREEGGVGGSGGGYNESEKQSKKQVVVADFGCGDAKLAERLLSLQVTSGGELATKSSSKKKKNNNDNASGSSNSWCPFKVHSFDLVSGGNPLVTPADISNVNLPNESVDVGVYCLALMGTNVADFVREGWRVLKFGGVLRVAEVRSRFETASAGEETRDDGGGKRGKLNNGHKQKNKHGGAIGGRNNQEHNEDTPKPLMLLDEFISLMERCGFQCTHMDQSNKMFLFMDFVKADGSKGLSDKERFTAKPCIYKRR